MLVLAGMRRKHESVTMQGHNEKGWGKDRPEKTEGESRSRGRVMYMYNYNNIYNIIDLQLQTAIAAVSALLGLFSAVQ